MRVVLDTNVLVSGVLNPHGPPGRILDAAVAGRLKVLYDDRILAEYRAVLLRPVFGFTPRDVDALLDFMVAAGEPVSAAPLRVVLPDPSDLPFLEVAATAWADALVTGNARHFRPRRGRHTVPVFSPAEFLERLS
jgi:putative PIN family toxin of toxin-antitoxin system